MDDALLSSLFFILTPVFLFLVIKKYFTPAINLPPGPRPWPIIGNMHQMGKSPHVTAASFAQKYGPLVSFRLGTKRVVVASTPEAATEFLKTQDRYFSGRSIPDALQQTFIDYYLVWAADCNDHWKSLRTLCRTEMFSAKAIEGQFGLRNEKLNQMLDFLHSRHGKVVKIEEVVFTTLFNTLSNVLFSKDFLDLNDEHGTAHGLKWKLLKILQNSVTPNISDFFPIIGGLDLQGLRRDCLKNLNALSSFSEGIIKERRAARNESSMAVKEKDFLDRLLEHDFTNEQINILVLELFIAGTDTVTATTEWAMAELVKNKEVMHQVQKELISEVNSSSVMETDLSKLTYFNACIKETLRLHPVVPLLIPRRALQTCEVMNYTIPQNSEVWINIWAISRDPRVWEDPNSFKPERFLDSNLDFKGHDLEFIPFGAGRRMCPGLPSAIKSVQTILASLILQFDWALPDGEDPSKLDMTEKFGVTLQMENPLHLVFNPKE